MAVRSGQRVAVPSLTSATDQVWALPSGSFEREMYPSPVRVLRGGRWVPVNLALASAGAGWWAPKAAVAEVKVSGQAAGPAARVRVGGVTLSWGPAVRRAGTGRVSGESLVWPLGLTVSALKEGVGQAWPVRRSEALKKGQEFATFPAGVTGGARWRVLKSTGGVELVSKAGRSLGSVSPVLLESNAREVSGSPRQVFRARLVPEGSGAKARLRVVAAQGVPAGFVGRANSQWTSGQASDTWVQKTKFETSQQSSKDLLVGVEGTAYRARSFLTFNTAALNGVRILSAAMDMTQFSPAARVRRARPIHRSTPGG